MRKTCERCKRTLPLDDFYPCSTAIDGHRGACKECKKADSSKYYKEHREEMMIKQRAYWLRVHGPPKELLTKEERKARDDACKRAWRERNPQADAAHKTSRRALLSGLLTMQPCEICGKSQNTNMHLEDYSKPLEVTFLCPSCHQRFHWNNHLSLTEFRELMEKV